MSGHTATPWEQKCKGISHNICTESIYTPHGMFTMSAAGLPKDGEMHANAAFIVTACNAYERLEAENTALRELLRELEWAGSLLGYPEGELFSVCPHCLRTPKSGHNRDCRLDAAITEVTE